MYQIVMGDESYQQKRELKNKWMSIHLYCFLKWYTDVFVLYKQINCLIIKSVRVFFTRFINYQKED
jgi:hypothetical protein